MIGFGAHFVILKESKLLRFLRHDKIAFYVESAARLERKSFFACSKVLFKLKSSAKKIDFVEHSMLYSKIFRFIFLIILQNPVDICFQILLFQRLVVAVCCKLLLKLIFYISLFPKSFHIRLCIADCILPHSKSR